MLLFYSNHCTASRMLIDSIKRYNGTDYLKLVNVESYKSKLPKQIHSVPALLFPETKNVIFGKQVFDYLLLPGKGYLFNLPKKQNTEPAQGTTPGEPLSFSLNNSSSDAYSFIDADNPDPHKIYGWSDINENIVIPTVDETGAKGNSGDRASKGLPDLGSLQSQRELQLQGFLQGVPSA